MALSRKPYQAYNAAMQTMPGTRQIVLLYDGIIRHLSQACDAMRQRRIQDRYNNLTRAKEIIFGLQSCLDFESGGQMAHILYDFYTMTSLRIFELHRSNDATACETLINEIKTMRDTWAEIDKNGGKTAASDAGGGTAGSAENKSSGAASGSAGADGMIISA